MPSSSHSPSKLKAKKRGLFFGFKLFLCLIVFVSLLVPLISPLTQYALVKGAKNFGAETVKIGSLQINLFQGEVSLKDFFLQAKGAKPLTVSSLNMDLDMLALWRGEINFRIFELKGLYAGLTLEPDRINLSGLVFENSQAEPVTEPHSSHVLRVVLNRLLLEDIKLKFIDARLDKPAAFELANERLRGDLELKVDSKQQAITIQGELNFDATRAAFLEQSVQWQQLTVAFDSVTGTDLLKSEGSLSLSLEGLDFVSPPQNAQSLSLKKFDAKLGASPSEVGLKLDVDAKAETAQALMQEQQIELGQLQLLFSGTVSEHNHLLAVTTSMASQGLRFNHPALIVSSEAVVVEWDDGQLAPSQVQGGLVARITQARAELIDPDQPAEQPFFAVQSLQAQAKGFQFDIEKLSWSAMLDFGLSSFSVGTHSSDWLSLSSLKVKKAEVDSGDQSAAQAGSGQLKVLQGIELEKFSVKGSSKGINISSTLDLDALSVGPLQVNDSGQFLLGQIKIGGLTLFFDQKLWSEQGSQALLPTQARAWLSAFESAKTSPVQANTPAPEPLAISIEQVLLGENSQIRFFDSTQSPPVDVTFSELTTQVRQIDTLKTDQTGSFELSSVVAPFGSLKTKGSFSSITDNPEVKANLVIEGLSLVPLSSYIEGALGYVVHSGDLGLTTNVVLTKGQLTAENNLELRQLYLERPDKEDASLVNIDGGLPLASSLNLLRDSDNNIHLEVPISGQLSKLSVGYEDILKTAFRQSVKKGAKQYLIYALQPYGTIYYLGKTVGELNDKMNLRPVKFVVGDSQLLDGEEGYVEKLAKLLLDRDALHLRACGRSVVADLPQAMKSEAVELTDEQKEWLIKLGNARAHTVKSLLQSKVPEAQKRIVICSPKVLEDTDAFAHVELMVN